MHFFIDHAKLTDQASSGDGFGPSSVDPTNKYDVSANFQLASEGKAFACQPGHLIVTDFFDVGTSALDPGLVNVILKPMAGLTVTFPTVKYYIYRGIKRDSFFTGSNFNAEGALSSCETVHKMWEDWHASTPQPLVPGDLGFDASLAGTVEIEEIFGNSRAPLRARQVKEGEWIGTFGFSKPICFEIIVEAELLDLNLDYARKSKVQIDISNMRAIPSPTPAQVHALRCEKEKVLAFVDPAALFGMHFSAGVSGFGLADAPSGDTLATTFLSHFSTATRVYLDIRSDKGYSYNFYDNYGGGGPNPKLIQFKPGAATAFSDDVYLNHGWPLFSQPGWTGPRARINLGLRLRIDDNTKPLLFVEDTDHLPRRSKNFIDQKKLLNGAAVDWSKALNLKLRGSGSGTKTCVATHVRLQYLKQNAGAVANPRLLQFNHRLDTVFGGIDLSLAGPPATFGELRNEKVGLAEGPDFAHVPDTGLYFDPDVVLLYGASRVAYRTNKRSYPTVKLAKPAGAVVRSPVFPPDIVFNRSSILEGGVAIPLIDLSAYKKGSKNTSHDGIYFLGLTRGELARLQATAGFGPMHRRFLVFDEAADHLDDNNLPYSKFEVRVQGLDASGQRIVVAPNPAVSVFGYGANMFCSSDFALFVNLPGMPPDSGLMKGWEFVSEGTYDATDPAVQAAGTPGEAPGEFLADDIGNDLRLTKPKVNLRARYYFPADAAGAISPSARKASYPLVVIAHGNGQFYWHYETLARYLAQNGFIVASINLLMALPSGLLRPHPSSPSKYLYIDPSITVLYDDLAGTVSIKTGIGFALQPWVSGTDFRIDRLQGTATPFSITFLRRYPEIHGLAPRGRADVIAQHLQVLQNKFGARIANSIGLIGHSRGGEAVVRVAATSGSPIKAIISLAPSDHWEVEQVSNNIPYFVLYGSRDGDLSGSRLDNRAHNPKPAIPSGSGAFSLYDRSVNGSVKSMSFVYGATHNGFTTTNKDFKGTAISNSIQQNITRAYMHAFLRQHLLGEQVWKAYFTGEFIPPSTGYTGIYQQYREMITGNFKTVDDFENSPYDWTQSSSAQAVTHSRAGTGLAEGSLHTLDNNSPHETSGLQIIDWNAGDRLTFAVLPGGFDARPWTHLSFRVTQVAGKANSTIDTMKVALIDAGTHRHEVALNKKVPDPDPRVKTVLQPGAENPSLRKSALMTIRLPLADYANNMDLSKVTSVQFVFPATGAGNIQIDELEFTK